MSELEKVGMECIYMGYIDTLTWYEERSFVMGPN